MDIDVLEQVLRSWSDRTAALTPAQWETQTRLPGWTVLDLFAHMMPDKGMVDLLRGPRVSDPAVTSGAQMLRIFNEPGGAAHTMADGLAEQARQRARGGIETLIRGMTESRSVVLDELRTADPSTGVAHPYLGSVSFHALIDTALVEATVHLLDLIAAVGGDPAPEEALRRTAAILSEVADPVTFIESATGRSTPIFPVMR